MLKKGELIVLMLSMHGRFVVSLRVPSTFFLFLRTGVGKRTQRK